MKLGLVNMDFDYATYSARSTALATSGFCAIAMVGDPTLFQRADMVEAGWSVIQPILDVWHALPPRDFPNYAAGSWGPHEAKELLERDGREWHNAGNEGLGQRNRTSDRSIPIDRVGIA